VHGLVKKLGGQITCRSSRAGTTFEILLPAAHGAGMATGAKARVMDSV
jgi:signal transduction histidine kinase